MSDQFYNGKHVINMHFLDFVFNIVSLFIWHNDNYLQLHTKENQHLANFLHLNFRYFMVQYLKKSMKYNTTTEYYNLSTCSYRLSHIPCPNSPVTFSTADRLPLTFNSCSGIITGQPLHISRLNNLCKL